MNERKKMCIHICIRERKREIENESWVQNEEENIRETEKVRKREKEKSERGKRRVAKDDLDNQREKEIERDYVCMRA